MKALGVLAFLLAAASTLGCSGLMCTELGCASGVTASLDTGDMQALDGASVRVCREGDCVDGSIAVDGGIGSCTMQESPDFFTSCNVGPGGVVTFTITFRNDDVDDEEAFSFTIASPANGELASKSGDITIEKTEINGSGCGYCYEGSL